MLVLKHWLREFLLSVFTNRFELRSEPKATDSIVLQNLLLFHSYEYVKRDEWFNKYAKNWILLEGDRSCSQMVWVKLIQIPLLKNKYQDCKDWIVLQFCSDTLSAATQGNILAKISSKNGTH